MPEVLIASPDARLASELRRRLPEIPVHFVSAADWVIEWAASVELLILDDKFVPETAEFLAGFRPSVPDLLTIYCLDAGADAKLVRQLLLDLRVNELLFQPVDPEALAQKAASLLGVAYSPVLEPVPGIGPEDELARRLSEAWSRAKSRMLSRVDTLERAGVEWLEGKLPPGLRQEARAEAHRLAGSLGTFGRPAGTRFARELERALDNVSTANGAQALRFVEVAAALRLEIERSSAPPQDAPVKSERDGSLIPALLVSSDPNFAAHLTEEAIARHWPWQSVPDAEAARNALAESSPAAVLIDVDGGGTTKETLDLVSDLAGRTPPTAAIILTSSGSLADRVEVARRGGRGFFLKSLPPAEIVQAALALLDRQQARAHVIAVDDDSTVLDALGAVLGSEGIRLTGLNDPLALWDTLRDSPPDLLLLDIEMPQVSGIELCRVVRNDLRWAAIPIVFLTALADAETVRRVFAAGADDFVSKPVVGPELVTRINNRLERTRLLRSLTEVDALTGLPNRVKCRNALSDFLGLADRHGQPMGVAVLSIDGLEHLNQERGAGAGDEVLAHLGRSLREELRSEEIAGRWGGNQFAVGLYGLDCQASLRRLQDALRRFDQGLLTVQPASPDSSQPRITISGGLAGYPADGSDLDGLLLAAGEARQRAIGAGGNQLVVAISDRAGLGRVDVVMVSRDEAVLSLLAHGLEPQGYRTRGLRSGLTAARALCGPERSLHARVLLIDADLPGFDSLALVRQLASEGLLRQTTVIMLSAASVSTEAMQALEVGASDVIAKPVDLPVLLDRVRQELEGRTSPPSGAFAGSTGQSFRDLPPW